MAITEQKVIDTIVDVIRERISKSAAPSQAGTTAATARGAFAEPPMGRAALLAGAKPAHTESYAHSAYQAAPFWGHAPAQGSGRRGFYTSEPYLRSFTSLKGRPFFSEHDVRERIRGGGKSLTFPKGAILSPLVQELVQEKGIQVRYE